MKILIVDDDFNNRKLLNAFLSGYGRCDIAVDGEEAVKAFNLAWEEAEPYDLICLDIMMPGVDGHTALRQIRDIEAEKGVKGSKEVKVIMVSALNDVRNVVDSFHKGGATAYIVKPVSRKNLEDELGKLGLI